uniref:Uncharacterized protein n=1 Tax=Trichuris muris TaxID=70415 RepID=A0A5S6QU43_TRIMR
MIIFSLLVILFPPIQGQSDRQKAATSSGSDLFEHIGGLVGQMMTKFTAAGGPAVLWSQTGCQSDPIECEYWQCIMDNIKNSPQIANLKLGSKIMFDPELRHLFATNPELLANGCQSSGAPRLQCDLFSNLLQIVDTAATKTSKPRGTGTRNRATPTHTVNNQRLKMTSTGYPDFDTNESKQYSRASNDYSDYYDTKTVNPVTGNRNILPNGGNPSSTYQPKDCDAILLRKYNTRGKLRRRTRD